MYKQFLLVTIMVVLVATSSCVGRFNDDEKTNELMPTVTPAPIDLPTVSSVPSHVPVGDSGEGVTIDTINADIVSELFEFTAPLDMFGINGYLIMRNWDMTCAMYKLENELEVVIKPEEGLIALGSGEGNYYSSDNSNYIFFYTRRFVENILYVYDIKNQSMRKLSLGTGDDYSFPGWGYVDDFGNIMLVLCRKSENGKLDYSTRLVRYIRRDRIEQFMTSAKR